MDIVNYYDNCFQKDDNKIYKLERILETEDSVIRYYKSIGNVETLEEAKARRINENKQLLEKWQNENFLISPLVDGIPKPYEISTQKQLELMQCLALGQLQQQSGMEVKLTFNAKGGECIPFTLEELSALSLQMQQYVYPAKHYCATKQAEILSCSTIEEVESVVIDYYEVYKDE